MHTIWFRKNNAYAEKNPIPTVIYGGGSLMLWGYFASTCPGNFLLYPVPVYFSQKPGVLCSEAENLNQNP
jgi:hypothetical protein